MQKKHARSSVLPSGAPLALEQIEREVPSLLFQLATDEDAEDAGLRAARIGSATVVAASGIDAPAFNRVLGLGIGEPASEPLLDDIIDWYRATGGSRLFVKVSPMARPPALFEWLRARGFVHHHNRIRLFRGAQEPPPRATDLHVEEIAVEEIAPEQAETFAATLAQAFGWPPRVQPLLVRLVGQPGWKHYLAFDGRTLVAAASLYVGGSVGHLGPAATLPAYRRRGAQRALLARRLRDAAALGCTVLATETAEDRPDHPSPSFRNVQRFGFEVAYLSPNYLLHLPSPSAVKDR